MTDELFSLFKHQTEKVSAEVYRVQGIQQAVATIKSILNQIAIDRTELTQVLLLRGSILADASLAELDQPGVEVQEDNFSGLAPSVQVGISQLDLAIADTGTLCQDATEVSKRLVSTLPPVHIALVPTAGLVDNLGDALEKYHSQGEGQVPGYLAFITGPSRTADIERVLTIGVHGPERLIVLFVDQVGGDNYVGCPI